MKSISNNDELITMFSSLKYGNNIISFDFQGLKSNAESIIEATNIYFDEEVIWMKQAVESIEAEHGYIEREIPDVYSIVYAEKECSIPDFTDDELEITKNAQKTLELESIISFEARVEFSKHIRKVAREKGIRVSNLNNKWTFAYKKKNKSALSIIKEGIVEGKSEVKIHNTVAQLPTVRVYASQMSQFSENKISVTSEGEYIVIKLKPDSLDKKFKKDLIEVLDKYKDLPTEEKRSIIYSINI